MKCVLTYSPFVTVWRIVLDLVGGEYKGNPPWDIGRPQPAFVELVGAGEFNKGSVLDVGCGTGENALYIAESGFSAVGVDLSSRAIVAAKAKANGRG